MSTVPDGENPRQQRGPSDDPVSLPLADLSLAAQIRPVHGPTVAEYVESLADLPPVVVFTDGTHFWLADGFHRWSAHRQAGHKLIRCRVYAGDLDDARLHAATANKAHGRRMTPEDRDEAIRAVLSTAAGRGWSDRQVARHVGCRPARVAEIRAEGGASASGKQMRTVTRGGKTYEMETGAIGKSAADTAAPGRWRRGTDGVNYWIPGATSGPPLDHLATKINAKHRQRQDLLARACQEYRAVLDGARAHGVTLEDGTYRPPADLDLPASLDLPDGWEEGEPTLEVLLHQRWQALAAAVNER